MPAKFDFSHLPGHVEHTPDYDSDNLESADYRGRTRMLTIKFRSGRSYVYGPIAPGEVASLKLADKVGKGNAYFRSTIAPRLIREVKSQEGK